MFNTIRLLRGEVNLTKKEIESFHRGDAIYGCDREVDVLRCWDIDQQKAAELELEKFHCSYNKWSNGVDIVEYALEYCECDEYGDFVQGSDYNLAAAE